MKLFLNNMLPNFDLFIEGLYSDSDEEEELETVGIRGEYWFDEHGDSMYADGDIGDMNHEAYVIQRCIGELAGEFNVHRDDDYLESGSSLEEEIMEEVFDDVFGDVLKRHKDKILYRKEYGIVERDSRYKKFAEKLNNIVNTLLDDPAIAITKSLVEHHNMTQEDANDLVLTAYGSTNDARDYAIKKWNWARVHGDSIECNKLDSTTLKNIASGINNALSEEGLTDEYSDNLEVLDKHPYTISTYTGKRYEITLEDMENGNISGLEQSDLETKNSAATQQVKQMDISNMPDYYKRKGVIGDSYKNINQVIHESSEHLYSWLTPDGTFLPIQANHGNTARSFLIHKGYHESDVFGEMFRRHYFRILFDNYDLYCHNNLYMPSLKQLSALKNLAIENNIKCIKWDNDEEDRILWCNDDW